MSSLFVFMLFTLQIFYWVVGKRASKNLKNKEDYFLAGKEVTLFPLTMTFLATIVGGGVILGASEEAYLYGWPVLLYPMGNVLGLLLLGLGLGRKLAEFQVTTVAEIFEVSYQSPLLRKAASILSVVSLFMILVGQIIGSNKFLVSMGLDNTLLFILFWTIIIIYTAQGGLRAVISTDKVQALFFSCILLACFGFVIFTEPSIPSMEIPRIANFENVSSKLCGWLLMPLLFMVIEQDIGQRCFAGASPKIVSKAAILAGIGTTIICIIPIFFGMLANTMELQVPNGGSVFITLVEATTAPWFTALVGCAILAAIVSTATSLINAISSNLAEDFQFSKNERTGSLSIIQWMTCLISFAAIFAAFYFNNIVDILVQSYELSVSCLFVPVLMALLKKKGYFYAALFSIIFGAAGFIYFRIAPMDFPREVASILFSFIGYGLGQMLSYYLAKPAEEPVV